MELDAINLLFVLAEVVNLGSQVPSVPESDSLVDATRQK